MEKTMKARVQHKHDIEANWLKATNFTPLASEIIVYDPDENYDYPRIKIGDGETNINALPFVTKEYAKISDIPTKPEDIGALPDSTVIPTVPTKISAFENDKGYLTQHQSLDAYAKTADLGALATKDSLTASDVGALPDTTKIPNTLADLTADSTHRTVTDTEKNTWNAKANTSDIPTKVSDLTNDKGYITSYTETDPTVPTWAKADTKPAYTASEVGALPSTTKIPGALSDLSEDTTHRVVTDAEKEVWNAKSNFSGNYADLNGKPTIPTVPTKISAFENDAKYLTIFTETDPTVPDWAKAKEKPTYTADEVGALPDSTEIPSKLSDLDEDASHRLVTDTEKAAWNAKSNFSGSYNDLTNKPTIPSITGLASTTYVDDAVKNKVDKDGNKVLSTNDYTTAEKNKLAGIAAGAEVNVNADWNATSGDAQILNKPTFGSMAAKSSVAKSDLASGVQTSLDKADSALQPGDISDWAKQPSKPGYTKGEVGLGNVDNVKQYSASNPPVVAQDTAPTDTSVIWVDTDDNTVDEFQDAVNMALAQAKESGEFTPVKGVDYFTDADQESIVQQIITALGTPVFGTVDADKKITLSTDNLVDGTYELGYEDKNGNWVKICDYVKGGEVDYNIPVNFNVGKIDYNNGGAIVQANDYCYSDLIPIESGKKYYLASKNEGVTFNAFRVVYYDADGNFLSVSDSMTGVGSNNTLATMEPTVLPMSSNAAGFRLCIALNQYQVDGYASWYTAAFEYMNKNAVLTWRADEEPSYTNLLNVYEVDRDKRVSTSGSPWRKDCLGMIAVKIPFAAIMNKTLRIKAPNIAETTLDGKPTLFCSVTVSNTSHGYVFNGSDGSLAYAGCAVNEGNNTYSFLFNDDNVDCPFSETSTMHVSIVVNTTGTAVTDDELTQVVITIDEPIV